MRRSAREALQEALAALGDLHGHALALDAHGVITIELADGVLCSLEAPQADAHVYLHVPVLDVPQGAHGARLMARALARNAFGLRMATAWFALDGDGRTLLLCAGVPAAGLQGGALGGLLAEVHREVLDGRAALADPPSAAPGGPPAADGEHIIRA